MHATVAQATTELGLLRQSLSDVLRKLGLRAAASGTHPPAMGSEVAVTAGRRYEAIASTMCALAEREPTMALHVHVAVPGGLTAVGALDGLRDALPLLSAISANSPVWRGRDSGFASMRTPVFSMSPPPVGIPRRFGSFAARDGMSADVVDRLPGRRRPVRDAPAEALGSCRALAAELGCAAELDAAAAFSADPGYARRRRAVARDGLAALLPTGVDEFRSSPALTTA